MKNKYFLSFLQGNDTSESYIVKLTGEEYEKLFHALEAMYGSKKFTLCNVTFFRDIDFQEAISRVRGEN